MFQFQLDAWLFFTHYAIVCKLPATEIIQLPATESRRGTLKGLNSERRSWHSTKKDYTSLFFFTTSWPDHFCYRVYFIHIVFFRHVEILVIFKECVTKPPKVRLVYVSKSYIRSHFKISKSEILNYLCRSICCGCTVYQYHSLYSTWEVAK